MQKMCLRVLCTLTKQAKKYLSPKKKVRLSTWREVEDSQIGQLMYYFMLAQLKSLVQTPLAAPHPILGLFMEEGNVRHTHFWGVTFWHTIVSSPCNQVTPVIATLKNEDSHWGLGINQLGTEHLAEGGLAGAISLIHSFLGAVMD